MKLLITGAGGQLGREWVAHCEKGAIDHVALDSSALDITDPEKLALTIEQNKPDVIINCAAYTKVDQAEEDKDLAAAINTGAVTSLAGICAQKNVKLVHYSTDYVFAGDLKDKEQFPGGYPEGHPTAPINIYGRTKREGELAVMRSGCEYLILRVSWLCGRYGSNFIKKMLRLGAERNELAVVNDQFGCPTFTEPVVDQSLKLLENKAQGVFHLSSGGVITWYDLACAVFEYCEMDVDVRPVSSSAFKTKAPRPAFSKLSTQKIESMGIAVSPWNSYLDKLLEQIC